ncbi:hypothetical protein [Streptomyces sp. NPDC057280]|uniref:hypothetical protein n=1 Tax=Streptomyces sp. NPDC057280 TaxID=3346081 RepID=UPI003641B9E8
MVIGIATLAFTGWATFVQAQVAADQLDQSKEAAEEQARSQATRTAAWLDQGPDGAPRIHVANRSPDPVSQVLAVFSVEDSHTSQGGRLVLGSGGVAFESVGPCTELVVDVDFLDLKGHWNSVLKKHKLSREDLLFRHPLTSFTDSKGDSWVRSESDLMKVDDGDADTDNAYYHMQNAHFMTQQAVPAAKQTPSCGSSDPAT